MGSRIGTNASAFGDAGCERTDMPDVAVPDGNSRRSSPQDHASTVSW
jgi:hypothetical protein